MNIRGVLSVVLALVFAIPTLSGFAQVTSSSNGGSTKGRTLGGKLAKTKDSVNTTNCTVVNRWQPQKLENNSTVLPAAEDFAGQLAGNYDFANKNKKSGVFTAADLIAGSDNGLINAIISAANPSRIVTNVAESMKKCAAASTTADTNKQTGAPSGSDGSTSTTELTGIPELLSIAVENGSVTSSVSGSTMTLSTSLYGLLTGFGLFENSAHNYDRCYICVRLGASSTFNVANASSPLSSVTRKEVSQWQLKYSIFDQSTRSARVKELWDGTSEKDRTSSPQAAASRLAADARPDWRSAASNTYSALETALEDYTNDHLADIVKCVKMINANTTNQTCSVASAPAQKQPATTEGLANLVLQGLDSYPEFQATLANVLADPGTPQFAMQYQTSLEAYNKAVTKFEANVDNLSKGFNADVTFGQQFPTSTPTTAAATSAVTASSGRTPDYLVGGLDLSWQPKVSQAPPKNPDASDGMLNTAPAVWAPNWTFNGKSSFYTEPNAALKENTFRGVQAATQFQWTLGASPFVSHSSDKSKVTLALNGSYQRLPENKDQKGKRPDITSGSFKLTLPFPGGISFPLAVTYGNSQQQQAKGSYVSGNFGFSFDADKLAALLALKK